MTRIYIDADADPSALEGRTIAILGYGSQGHAHALNLTESGCAVVVGSYEGSASGARAAAAGLTVLPIAEATRQASVIMVLLPDTRQAAVYAEHVAPNLSPGDTLMFAHGFNIHYGQITPPDFVDVSMVAPKTPGHRLRQLYQEGFGAPGLLAIHQDPSGSARATAMAYARGIGCTRAGVLETTFAEETETDLFGEQAIICGGVTALIRAGFETLVEAGYQPEIAYFECLHEMKLIIDLIYQGGLETMRDSISDTAEYGDFTRGPRIIDDAARAEMKRVLAEVQDGRFAREWILENQAGRPALTAMRRAQSTDTLSVVGRRLRELIHRPR